jgi:hypothetical protein
MNKSPDNWVVAEHKDFYKLFMSWHGGYTTGNSWWANSGIIGCTKDEYNRGSFIFKGNSGSTHTCKSGSYGLSSTLTELLNRPELKEAFTVLPHRDWSNFDWSKDEDSSS